ncbi:hypothetical protein [Photobacterium lutimaris]|uniref:Uncharacterized protein n=1 Tax=Photobacterium lutimaris TaxID=388278 RepID=A0A2T3IQA4_9GAMM|nr:hypothetical protein [Photobacterium lutimaris]PSU30516.1 hypothetical protein C9I99_23415 [Photobacterium lutimaris]TDR76082.1 hypothetical protein DFP78_10373 [Photobacterium lutimaris]
MTGSEEKLDVETVFEINQPYFRCDVDQAIAMSDQLILKGYFPDLNLTHDGRRIDCHIISLPFGETDAQPLCLDFIYNEELTDYYAERYGVLKTDTKGEKLYIPRRDKFRKISSVSKERLLIWENQQFRSPYEREGTDMQYSNPEAFAYSGDFHAISHSRAGYNSQIDMYVASKDSPDGQDWSRVNSGLERDAYTAASLQYKNLLLTEYSKDVSGEGIPSTLLREVQILNLDTGELIPLQPTLRQGYQFNDDIHEGHRFGYFTGSYSAFNADGDFTAVTGVVTFDPVRKIVAPLVQDNNPTGELIPSYSGTNAALYIYQKNDDLNEAHLSYIDLRTDLYHSDNLLESGAFADFDVINGVLRYSNGIFVMGTTHSGQSLRVYHNHVTGETELHDVPPTEIHAPIPLIRSEEQ